MNDLRKTTITTLEVAEMMETDHWKLLRKLEGDKKSAGIIKILNDNNFVVADYFIKSAYVDVKGKERPCYEVTRLGCDFLANKSTGEKGVLFTARYVKRFYELENNKHYIAASPTDHPGEVAKLLRITSRHMEKQGSEPYEVAENAKLICEQYGIMLSPKFVKVPEYVQMKMADFLYRDTP